MSVPYVVRLQDLPTSGALYENLESKFFKNSPGIKLPSTDDVMRANAEAKNRSADYRLFRPGVLLYCRQNLLVKFNGEVNQMAEAQTLWAVRHYFKGAIPVPEVYGWRQDARGTVFIYMEYVQGRTLEECWPTATDKEKEGIAEELKRHIDMLRTLSSPNKFIGEYYSTVVEYSKLLTMKKTIMTDFM